MADAFISYSRKNSDFGRNLHTALVGQGRNVWMDWRDIPHTAEWWTEITSGIDFADNFIVLISPDSIASPICTLEIAHARSNNKRIVPVVIHQTNEREAFVNLMTVELTDFQQALIGDRDLLAVARDNWTALAALNWIFFSESDDFDIKLHELMEALDLDIEAVHEHTRLLNRAKDWDRRGRLPSFLLRDDDLIQAENWLVHRKDHQPASTEVQEAYIHASRTEQDKQTQLAAAQERRTKTLRRASIIAGGVGVVAVLAALASLIVGTQAINDANIQRTVVIDAHATLTPIPQTLTPIAETLSAGQTQIAAVPPTLNALATKVKGRANQIESSRLAAEADDILNSNEGDAEIAALLSIQALRIIYTTQATLL